jgi:HK97 family phage portal protein
MGLIRRLLTTRAVSTGHPSQHSLAAIFGLGRSSYAGVPVTDESAMTYSAVFSAIRLLAWSTAMLPLLVYRRQGRGKERATDHPLYPLLHSEANAEMTAFEFRSTLMSHAVGTGNGYAEIEWSNAGVPLALWPLNPRRMTPERVKGELRYLYQLPDGTTANLPSWRVHHIRGLSSNGVIGYSPVRLAMQAIGLGLATEEFGSRFFGNGARPGMIIRHPGELSDAAYDRLRSSWNAEHEGLSNSHRVKILEEGMEIETVGVPPEEAQFLETRKFQVTEIARWFNVPPHMIADMSGATFSNIEEQGVGFVTYSLGPWLTNSEQALSRDLLMPAEKQTLLIEHLVDGLLRGRTSERYQAYQLGLQGGWMSPNEVRERENMNPYDGGDTYLLPMNMAPASTTNSGSNEGTRAARGVSRETDPKALGRAAQERRSLADDRRNTMEAYVPLFEDVAARMVRREVQDLQRALDKFTRRRNLIDFEQWLVEYYAGYAPILGDAFRPLILSLAQLIATQVGAELGETPVTTEEIGDFVEEYVEALGEGVAASSRGQITTIMREAESEGNAVQEFVVEKIQERLEGWLETKARKLGRKQAYRAGNGLIVANYTIKGVRKIEWLTNSGACAFCAKLDGKIVSIEEFFIAAGDRLTGGAGDTPMVMRSNARSGPIHDGCSCTIRASEKASTATAPSAQTRGSEVAKEISESAAGRADAELIRLSGLADTRTAERQALRDRVAQLEAGIFPEHVAADERAGYLAAVQDELAEMETLHRETVDAWQDAIDVRAKAMKDFKKSSKALFEGGKYKLSVGAADGFDKEAKARVKSAAAWLKGFINNPNVKPPESLWVALNPDDRAAYFNPAKKITAKNNTPTGVFLHEMGHAIEYADQTVRNAVGEFYKRRTKGYSEEPLQNFGPGYRADEMTIRDLFPHAYVGKRIYPDGASEVISMGLQLMYEDPVKFAREDPDYFALIYDLFREGGE